MDQHKLHHNFHHHTNPIKSAISRIESTMHHHQQQQQQRSMSSLSTHSNDSYLLKRNGYGERARSPSPTDFFRTKIENYDHIWLRKQELNEFIHNGIQKFLDKQAVRDLIHAYDLEDIFVNGREEFFENLFTDENNNIIIDNEQINKNISNINNNNNNNKGKFSQFIDVSGSQMIRAANQSKINNSNQQQQQQQLVAVHHNKSVNNRSLLTFFSSAIIEIFGVKVRHLAHQRRESHQLNTMIENQLINKSKK